MTTANTAVLDNLLRSFYFRVFCFVGVDSAGKVDEKATQLHAIASLKVLLDATKPQRGAATSTAASNVRMNFKETTLVAERPNGIIDTTLETVSAELCRPKKVTIFLVKNVFWFHFRKLRRRCGRRATT